MKKTFIFIIALLAALLIQLSANAVPAKPGMIEFSQPDGTSLKIYLHGDEKIKWATSLDGYTLIFNSEGYYEYATLNINYDLVPSGIIAKDIESRSISENNFLSGVSKNLFYSTEQVSIMQQIWDIYDAEAKNGTKAFPTTGDRKLICILIGFTDKAFVKTQADFNALFNQVGYTAGGATGSVKDYYLENSYNQFNLTVDVAGPYTASQNMAYYGANDGSGDDLRPRELVTEAVTLADPDVNYANYDNDNNGTVDAVYVIYAGYGEEAGGPSTAIWAHAWSITTVVKDGKSISKYSCSAELRGYSGTNITRIGVICHEFGHVLGAPDYYDTDYATNGQYDGTGEWDMMAGGSWNNGGATPAHHNPYTKIYIYGWASAITISTDQNVALLNSVQNSESFYRYNTTTSNEYFLVENRQNIGFDAYVPGHGMLIYHVDGSYISSNPYSVNASSHQGMFPMAANATTANGVMTGSGAVSTSGCPWPGTSSKTTFTDATTPNAKSWASVNTAKPITNITEASGVVQFCFISCPPDCTPPTTQATNFSATDIGDNQMTIGWTRGNGNNVLVVGRKVSAVDANPINGINYTADASFGAGMEIGTGNYVVYKGTGDNVVVTDLIPGSVYHFAIYEFFTADNCYTIPALKGSESTTGIVPSYCDTLSQFCCTPTIYTSANGYVGGTNEYSCLGIAEYFEDPSPYNQVTGARIYLAAANNGTSPNVTFVLWDNENGGPTNQLATSVIPLATVVTAYNNDGYIDIDFGGTYNVPAGGFSIGFLVPGTPASGDTLAVVTNTGGEGEDTGYCLFGTSWSSYNSAGWGIVIQNAIFPFTCFQNDLPPVAGFVGYPTRIPLGSTVQFTDLSAGTTPTSWSWTFEGGFPEIETEPNPLITYNTLGFFDVTLEVSNANGTDEMIKTDYIEVFDPNGITAFSLDFEACTDFQVDDFDPWTTVDVDLSTTYGSSGFDFLNESYTGSFIAFNSHNTTPEATGWEAHGGALCGICMAATTPPNNDWLISTQITLGENSSFNFWAKSITADYGLERFKVLVSTTDNLPASFTVISAGTYVQAPVTWTEYNYDLSAYDNQTVYVAIQCVSNDAYAFMVDDIEIYSEYLPPVCDFIADNTNVTTGTTVNFTDLSTQMPTIWSWYFPGGTPSTSTEQNPSIEYNIVGTYEVSLTVTNSEGTDDEFKAGYITVSESIVEWHFPTTSADNLSDGGITENNGTKTILPFGGVNDIKYTAAGVSTQSIDGETWDGGNNTKGWQINFVTTGYGTLKLAYAQMSNHANSPRDFKIQYSLNGSSWTDLGVNITLVEDIWYQESDISLPPACENQANVYLRWIMTSNIGCGGGTVNSTVTTRRNAMDNIIITGLPLNTPPVAEFSASDTEICEGESITFTDESTDTPTAWVWTFDGGNPATSTIQNPEVIYSTAGTYQVELIATNGSGSDTETKIDYITVNPLAVAPTSVSASITEICEAESTTLSYTGGSGDTFNWYSVSCGGTSEGTGQDLIVSPTSTTTYYGSWENSCGESTCEQVTVTVNPLPVAPTSVTATDLTICDGESTTLSYNGGSGTTFAWFTVSCGGTPAGTGNDLIVSPTVTTTYYGRWENSCGESSCETVTITVDPLPIAPTSVDASLLTICSGESTVLSYAGGSGTTFTWYTESCGGTSVGTGNDFSVSPTVTTTYYGRWETTCGESACEEVTITVNPLAVTPTSVTASDLSICNGESTFLTYTGGSGTTFNWYTGSCGGVLVGTGDNFEVNPTANTTYYGTWETSCGISTCKTVAITVIQLPVEPVSVDATDTEICSGESTSLSYTGGSGNTFAWYSGSCVGTPEGTGNNLVVNPIITTTYYGRWESSCGNSVCESVTITVNESPAAPIVDVDCSGGPDFAVITVTSPVGIGYEYSLSGGSFQSGTTFSDISNGNYYIDVKSNGCTTTGTNFGVSCGCANPTELTLSAVSGATCGTTDYSVNNNTFGGSATEVNLIHNGNGSLDQTNFTSSPFSFTYTPDISDSGDVITITVTTDNPLGSPCLAYQSTFNLTVNPLPVEPISVEANNTVICDGESATLSYSGGSGTTFRWYTESCGGTLAGTGNNLIVSPTVTTTYYGRWENSCGYSDCETVTITVNQIAIDPISVQATATVICGGENTELSYTGGSGDSFDWYTGSCNGVFVGTGNNLVVSPATTTTYYGNWTGACNNSLCEAVTITVNPMPLAPTSVEATQYTICEGESTLLSYTGGSGTTFKWYTDACGSTEVGTGNDLSVSPIVTTTYYGRWENSCGGSDCESVTITVNSLAVEPTVVGADNTIICSGENAHLIYAGGNGDVFKWYSDACGDTEIGEGNSLEVSPTVTTTYYGRWESTCGNSQCKSVTITVNNAPETPAVINADNSSICFGESVVLSFTGGSGLTFNWYTDACGSTLIGTGSIYIATPTTETTYYGRWENSCGVSDCESVTISVNDIPDVPVANYSCSGLGGAAVITVISPIGIGYTYSINGTEFQEETVFNNIPDGNYAITVAHNGCTTIGDIIGFDCLCDNPAIITLSPTEGIICNNESVFQLSGNTFGGSATEITISHNGTGTLEQETIISSPFDIVYNMGAEDYNNQVIITVTTNNPLGDPCLEEIETFTILPIEAPEIDLPESLNACSDELFEYTISDSYNYIIWSDDSEEATYSTTYTSEGEYSVWVTVGNNYCESVDTMTVVVTICSDISNNLNSGEFSLYPNPTNSNITLSINDYQGNVSYSVIDINGKEIISNIMFIDNNYNEEIDLQNCVPGMYFLRLTSEQESINYKIIKN